MYLHIGSQFIIPYSDIVGIFDADNCTSSNVTKKFLKKCEDTGRLIDASSFEIPKSFILCQNKKRKDNEKVYISQISPYTLKGRIEQGKM